MKLTQVIVCGPHVTSTAGGRTTRTYDPGRGVADVAKHRFGDLIQGIPIAPIVVDGREVVVPLRLGEFVTLREDDAGLRDIVPVPPIALEGSPESIRSALQTRASAVLYPPEAERDADKPATAWMRRSA